MPNYLFKQSYILFLFSNLNIWFSIYNKETRSEGELCRKEHYNKITSEWWSSNPYFMFLILPTQIMATIAKPGRAKAIA